MPVSSAGACAFLELVKFPAALDSCSRSMVSAFGSMATCVRMAVGWCLLVTSSSLKHSRVQSKWVTSSSLKHSGVESKSMSRRSFGAGAAIAAPAFVAAPVLAAPSAIGPPTPVSTQAAALEIPSARMPSWTMLVPIVELDNAIASWVSDAAKGSTGTVGVALDALCKGSILSSKNFYLGVGTKYSSSMVYDDFDKRLVEQDKNLRISAMVLASVGADAPTDLCSTRRHL